VQLAGWSLDLGLLSVAAALLIAFGLTPIG
jgi:hypothetical protein